MADNGPLGPVAAVAAATAGLATFYRSSSALPDVMPQHLHEPLPPDDETPTMLRALLAEHGAPAIVALSLALSLALLWSFLWRMRRRQTQLQAAADDSAEQFAEEMLEALQRRSLPQASSGGGVGVNASSSAAALPENAAAPVTSTAADATMTPPVVRSVAMAAATEAYVDNATASAISDSPSCTGRRRRVEKKRMPAVVTSPLNTSLRNRSR